MQYVSTWNKYPEYGEALRRHFENDLSAAQIAAALNDQFDTTFSRNAIIGRLHRLGLRREKSPKAESATVLPRARPMRTRKERKQHEVAFRKLSLRELAEALEATETSQSAEAVTIELLQHHHCRWPCGDPCTPEFRFCGATKMSESPYCARHHRMAYTKSREPRAYHFRQAAE